jgi:hypothetical protein
MCSHNALRLPPRLGFTQLAGLFQIGFGIRQCCQKRLDHGAGITFLWHPGPWLRETVAGLISRETVAKGGDSMNAEQIRDEIRKLNWIEKIGIYRWINEEVTGAHRVEAERSLKIRQEIERLCKFTAQEEDQTLNSERLTLH